MSGKQYIIDHTVATMLLGTRPNPTTYRRLSPRDYLTIYERITDAKSTVIDETYYLAFGCPVITRLALVARDPNMFSDVNTETNWATVLETVNRVPDPYNYKMQLQATKRVALLVSEKRNHVLTAEQVEQVKGKLYPGVLEESDLEHIDLVDELYARTRGGWPMDANAESVALLEKYCDRYRVSTKNALLYFADIHKYNQPIEAGRVMYGHSTERE